MQKLTEQLKFSHNVYGAIVFHIGNWTCRSIVYAGAFMWEVRRRDGTHPKKIYVEDNGTVGYFGSSIPVYVFDAVAFKTWNIQEYFKVQIAELIKRN